MDFPAFVMEDGMKGPKFYISFLIKWFIIKWENNDIQRRIIYESKKVKKIYTSLKGQVC